MNARGQGRGGPRFLSRRAEHCPDFARILRQATPDRPLFEQIADCFSDRLLRYARARCRDDRLGEDAFQDAMIATFTHLGSFRGDSPIEPWLRRIVVSACSRLRRGKKNSPDARRPLDDGASEPFLADPAPDQELKVALAERLELLRREVERLEEPNRSLLFQHDVEERPLAEIAARFEMTEEAVKSRLKRARATVRQALLERM